MSTGFDLLPRYQGLRLTDVCDGLDAVGIMDNCTMDWRIRPLWRDTEHFSHRIYGVAHTVRFVPTNRVVERPVSFDEHNTWKTTWYDTLAQGPKEPIKKNEIVVIDAAEVGDVGFIGSNNGQLFVNQGAVGYVTNGGCRDTDELIKQRVPVYSRRIGRGIRPGRLEWNAENVTVSCGGAMVNPGDIVVADGDGAIVVPIGLAERVCELAWEAAGHDKKLRRQLYLEAGIPLDESVNVRE